MEGPTATRGGRESGVSWTAAILLVAAVALAFQGSRGLWEPDEGFYANAALDMARSGDRLVPRVNGAIFLDKPPLQYWGMAAGVALLGDDEWGLRLANVVWITVAAIAVGATAGRMWGRNRRAFGTLAYGVMLGPVLAANVLTPDTPLACFVALLGFAYWRSATSDSTSGAIAWEVAAGVAAGLAALTKGPAALVFVAPILLHAAWTRGPRVATRVAALVLSATALIATLWYGPVVLGLPGAAAYLWDNQVWGRLASARYERNAGWAGAFKVYLPMMVLGTIPWTARLWRFGSGLAARVRAVERWPSREVLLVFQVVVPLAVFSIARSRLPLYVLPVLPAVALMAAGGARRERGAGRPGNVRAAITVTCWIVALVGIKATLAFAPIPAAHPLDSRALAGELRSAGVRADAEVVAIDSKENGLVAYGYTHLTWVRDRRPRYPFFDPPGPLEPALAEIAARRPRQVALLVRAGDRQRVLDRLPVGLRACMPSDGEEFVLLECAPTVSSPVGVDRGGGR